MFDLILIKTLILDNKNKEQYTGIAYDGKHMYTSFINSPKIYLFDIMGRYKGDIKTKRPYISICFDSNEGCFWGVSLGYFKTIYKLDLFFNEIGYVYLPLGVCGITSIGYSRITNSLLCGDSKQVYNIHKSGEVFYINKINNNVFINSVGELKNLLLKSTSYRDSNFSIISIMNNDYKYDNICCMPTGILCKGIFSSYNKNNTFNLNFFGCSDKKNDYYIFKYKCIGF
ncbi:MAG: hypothetical protein KFW09_01945 [Oscillospiraceae bacterium]|nr:hypothetical protein [Oscillospiraceae bacterium]